MEKKRYFLSKKLLWASVIVQIVMLSSATNITTTDIPPQVVEAQVAKKREVEGYAWSAWGSWSACSRTCGGGVSVQERQCLPRGRSVLPSSNSSIAPPVITVRVTRQIHEQECKGVDKRYHECNNVPCPGGTTNTRAEQCATYDRRPFRGRFYTWVPYIDGNSPCMLNCRPLGQHFYASLSLVADGTPCTKQGGRAICVQGTCRAVGHESVLAVSSSRELRCGRRLVSGLFSRPRLPLGYSYVTTVPRGACRLNVSEIMPSDNYIALKISNGSYIMNGEFAVSAPGTYEAAGARFLYTRHAGQDHVFVHGPVHHPIDIMILYTQPNPSIKYEYFTESLPGDIESESITKSEYADVTPTSGSKHFRRHHSYDSFTRGSGLSKHSDVSRDASAEESLEVNVVGSRKFVWKILSYTQCTRSCGGGIQLGKYRCVEANAGDREVSAVHCSGSAPPARRRRCGGIPCPPRWRAAAWSSCPKCGPATRHRIVGCVQDHARGITKISDQKCPAPKPHTTEKCNIQDCNELIGGEVRQITSKRNGRPKEHTDTFRAGPVYSVAVNSTDIDVGPEYSFSATAGWLYTEWSECVGWCVGGGIQTRGVRCADPSGCTPNKAPDTFRVCTPKITCEPLEGNWFTGEWSPCSGCSGKQVRGVLCIGGSGRHLKDSACKAPKPTNVRDCEGECSPRWFWSDWGQCVSNCTPTSTSGVQRRSVVCSDSDCSAAPQPPAQRNCEAVCDTVVVTTSSPAFTIESQRALADETPTTQRSTTKGHFPKGCKDKLNNCALAVQARLCHYNYYVQNCCHSCAGR
ncbi:ADAMTS-like protein 4 [Anticarsia gemmatalis]|uniref:ADAMTS-like protein 4 n=1 Tax=Anticarsia gemmatalis TaxID=129554 RepID=UPI003F769287